MMRVREDDKGGKRVTQDRARYDWRNEIKKQKKSKDENERGGGGREIKKKRNEALGETKAKVWEIKEEASRKFGNDQKEKQFSLF